MRRPSAKELWAERVRAWRESGQTATAYADGKEFEASTLRYWSSRLNRVEGGPRLVQLVPRREAPEARADVGQTPALVVEIGAAQVRVEAGFDGELLRRVVEALGGGI